MYQLIGFITINKTHENKLAFTTTITLAYICFEYLSTNHSNIIFLPTSEN